MPRKSDTSRRTFTAQEIDYLKDQRLGRMATVGPNGQPHVVPVAFRYNPETDTIDIGGHGGFARRKKWRDVQHHTKVAIVIDDIASYKPWKVRGVEVRGEAEQLLTGGETVRPGFDPEMLRIRPDRVVSWGLGDGDGSST
ncbi:MAG TPA: PPOX class F420-dependent oxidoreductase [Anaerolineales bacterium]|nr:PPOX class F420-dependent oxidoreductase [Anaerolineales bacterium]